MQKNILKLLIIIIFATIIPSVSIAGSWKIEMWSIDAKKTTINIGTEPYIFDLNNDVKCTVSKENIIKTTSYLGYDIAEVYYPIRGLSCKVKDKNLSFGISFQPDLPINSNKMYTNFATLFVNCDNLNYINLVYSVNQP